MQGICSGRNSPQGEGAKKGKNVLFRLRRRDILHDMSHSLPLDRAFHLAAKLYEVVLKLEG